MILVAVANIKRIAKNDKLLFVGNSMIENPATYISKKTIVSILGFSAVKLYYHWVIIAIARIAVYTVEMSVMKTVVIGICQESCFVYFSANVIISSLQGE